MAPPSAKCRICTCDFKIQFGTTARKDKHRSSENLFLPSKRRECFGTVLAEIIKSVGLQVPNDPSRYSSRVCNKCARKVRNLEHIYGEVKSSLEVQNNNLSTPNKENVAATKRLFNTSQGNSVVRLFTLILPQANFHLANRCPLRDGRIRMKNDLMPLYMLKICRMKEICTEKFPLSRTAS